MANELKTYGDLKKVIKSISNKQKLGKLGDVSLDVAVGFIPGGDLAKTTFDFIKAAFSKPDIKKTKTWLDKLDIDDDTKDIVDNTIENGFLKDQAKKFDSEPDDKPLENDFNMNAKLVQYIKDKHNGRTITGITENKMKKEDLKQIIKEEIKNILKEEDTKPEVEDKKSQPIQAIQKFFEGPGKNSLSLIKNPMDLKNILTLIWNGMNENFRDNNAIATSLKKVIDTKLK
jgi:hypothetical protein